jgi:NitT/TauT family transport system permease protein
MSSTPMVPDVPDALPALPASRSTGRIWLPRIVSLALLPLILLAWNSVTTSGMIPSILLPTPGAVWAIAPKILEGASFGSNFMRTISEIILGFLLGSGIGFGLGVLLGSIPILHAAYFPFLSAFKAIPTIILAPMIITWFGFGIEGKVVQATITCFYAVFITTLAGLEMVTRDQVRFMASLKASRWQALWKLRLPAALPAIFGGLQIAASAAIIGGIVSEFVAADAGLGFLLLRYKSSFNVPAIWVLIFVFLVLGLLSYVIIQTAERRIVFWQAGSSRRRGK